MEAVADKQQSSSEKTETETKPSEVLTEEKPRILKKFPGMKSEKKHTFLLLMASLLVVVAGVFSGWFLSGSVKGSAKDVNSEMDSVIKISDSEAGIEDESIFSDFVEGKLVEGGIEGEGTHHLERPGGVSQNVYLTSTVIDLQGFVDKDVQVWGETLSGKSAGWLMDVGKIKVSE